MSETKHCSAVDARQLESDVLANDSYRRVIYTVPGQFQLVLMSLLPSETIPEEQHANTVQFIRVEHGTALVTVNGDKFYRLDAGDSIVIPPHTLHKVINISNATAQHNGRLQFYTIYTPPEHPNERHQQRQ